MGIVQRKLSNGMRVNMVSMGDEPQKVSVRLYVPGGRMLENRNKPGSVFVGSRTLQEGGAFLDVTRYGTAHPCPSTHSLLTPLLHRKALTRPQLYSRSYSYFHFLLTLPLTLD
jgi:hypothetical protein